MRLTRTTWSLRVVFSPSDLDFVCPPSPLRTRNPLLGWDSFVVHRARMRTRLCWAIWMTTSPRAQPFFVGFSSWSMMAWITLFRLDHNEFVLYNLGPQSLDASTTITKSVNRFEVERINHLNDCGQEFNIWKVNDSNSNRLQSLKHGETPWICLTGQNRLINPNARGGTHQFSFLCRNW